MKHQEKKIKLCTLYLRYDKGLYIEWNE